MRGILDSPDADAAYLFIPLLPCENYRLLTTTIRSGSLIDINIDMMD